MIISDINWKLKFRTLQRECRPFGGVEEVRKAHSIHRRKSSSAAIKLATKKSFNLWTRVYLKRGFARLFRENPPPTPIIVDSFPSTLYYNDKEDNDQKEMEIDGNRVNFEFNEITNSKNVKAKKKAQPTASHFRDSNAPIITPDCGEVIHVQFEESELFVLFASKGSDCSVLRDIADTAYSVEGKNSEDALNDLPSAAWEKDLHAGGRYVAFGVGSMDKRQGCPFTLKNHKFAGAAQQITSFVKHIFTSVSKAIFHYLPDVYWQNDGLKAGNESYSFPPVEDQEAGSHCSWFATQFVIRRIGKGASNFEPSGGERTHKLVGLHKDGGDLSTMQFNTYIPRGGEDGLGGDVSDSQLVVCEEGTGGNYVIIETNTPGVVCVVIMDSSKMLHGLIEGESEGDEDASSTRIIPFVTKDIYNFMTKDDNAGKQPIDKYNVL